MCQFLPAAPPSSQFVNWSPAGSDWSWWILGSAASRRIDSSQRRGRPGNTAWSKLTWRNYFFSKHPQFSLPLHLTSVEQKTQRHQEDECAHYISLHMEEPPHHHHLPQHLLSSAASLVSWTNSDLKHKHTNLC